MQWHKHSGSIPRNAWLCRLRNKAMRDYQESVTTGQTNKRTDKQMPYKVISMCRLRFKCMNAKKLTKWQHSEECMIVSPAKNSYAWLPRKCDYRTDRQTNTRTDKQKPDKVIPMCRYASQATQKFFIEKSYVNLPCLHDIFMLLFTL